MQDCSVTPSAGPEIAAMEMMCCKAGDRWLIRSRTLSAGLGVIPFVACDISGYCGDIEDYPAMAELYTRWVQLGAFNPLSRIHHEGDVAVEPWLFGEEAEKNVKAAIEMKYRLLPYIYTYAREAYETGLPIMRPMFMEYPADLETVSTDAQFMFGSELLVAPVVKKGQLIRMFICPKVLGLIIMTSARNIAANSGLRQMLR